MRCKVEPAFTFALATADLAESCLINSARRDGPLSRDEVTAKYTPAAI